MMVEYIVIFERHIHLTVMYQLYNANIHEIFQICQKKRYVGICVKINVLWLVIETNFDKMHQHLRY